MMIAKHPAKYSILFAIMLMLCPTNTKAEAIEEQQALNIAETFFSSVRFSPKRINIRRIPIATRHMVRTKANGQTEQIPTYYVYTTEGGNGFVIVSGDDVAAPILAYSYSNPFPTGDAMPQGVRDMLNTYDQEIAAARQSGQQATEQVKARWQMRKVGKVSQMVETAEWGQNSPFNSQCPMWNGKRCITGCVATAYSILMQYYQYPKFGVGASAGYYTDEHNIYVESRSLSHEYHWDKMPNTYPSSGYGDERDTEVATLMADIGAFIQADYDTEGTGATNYHPDLLDAMGYKHESYEKKKNHSDNEWHQLLQKDLDEKHPIIYAGTGTGGHAFILDGYTDDNYYHVNWGWAGYCNGFFALNAMTPTGNNFSLNQEAMLGCYPENADIPQKDVAAVVGSQEFSTFSAALSFAKSTKEPSQVTLNSNVTTDIFVIEAGKDITIDLNGHLLAMTTDNQIQIAGTLTICDRDGEGQFQGNFTDNYPLLYNKGTLNLYNVRLVCNNAFAIYNMGVISIEGGSMSLYDAMISNIGKLTAKDAVWVSETNQYIIKNDGEMECNGVRVINEGSGYLMYTSPNSKTTLIGGEFACQHNQYVIWCSSQLDVYGTTITNTNPTAWSIIANSGCNATLYDGKFYSARGFFNNGGRLEARGGMYSTAPTKFLGEGCVILPNEDEETSMYYPYIVDTTDAIATPFRQTENADVFDLQGHRTGIMQKGINIVHMPDGTTRKVLNINK